MFAGHPVLLPLSAPEAGADQAGFPVTDEHSATVSKAMATLWRLSTLHGALDLFLLEVLAPCVNVFPSDKVLFSSASYRLKTCWHRY